MHSSGNRSLYCWVLFPGYEPVTTFYSYQFVLPDTEYVENARRVVRLKEPRETLYLKILEASAANFE